jgi:hypothetical protein
MPFMFICTQIFPLRPILPSDIKTSRTCHETIVRYSPLASHLVHTNQSQESRQLTPPQSRRIWPELVPNYLSQRHVPRVNSPEGTGVIYSEGLHISIANFSAQLTSSPNLTMPSDWLRTEVHLCVPRVWSLNYPSALVTAQLRHFLCRIFRIKLQCDQKALVWRTGHSEGMWTLMGENYGL